MWKSCTTAFIAIFIGFFFFVQDADFVTYFYDLYRHHFVTNCFEGKTVWIIGSSSGIGECLTYDTISNGVAKVILSARREKELIRVRSNAERIKTHPTQKIYTKPLDLIDFLSDEYSTSFISELYTQHPDIDIVIFNGGLAQRGLASNTSMQTTKRIFDVAVFSTMSIIHSILNNGINLSNTDRHYQFIATSSISAITGGRGQSSIVWIFCICSIGIDSI
eukprot:906464_1